MHMYLFVRINGIYISGLRNILKEEESGENCMINSIATSVFHLKSGLVIDVFLRSIFQRS
jgi:hypothetical protein